MLNDNEQHVAHLLEQIGFYVKPYSELHECDPANTLYTQFKLGKYRLDFALLNSKIAIEIDGYWHGEGNRLNAHQTEQRISDRIRDNFCSTQGWSIVRVKPTIKREIIEQKILQALEI